MEMGISHHHPGTRNIGIFKRTVDRSLTAQLFQHLGGTG